MDLYFKKDKDDLEYRSLERVEELYYGFPELLTVVCWKLIKKGKMNEAKGIYLRNNLKQNHFVKKFEKSSIADDLQIILKKLIDYKYD